MSALHRRSRNVVEDDEEVEQQRPRQRRRRDAPASEPEAEDSEEQEQPDDDAARDESAHSQLVKKLVRYALACEYSRTTIRREGIREKVLGTQGRSFPKVFDGAQKALRLVYGMEMVELPPRDKVTKEEKRKAAKSQNRTVKSNAYVLVTRLPEAFRKAPIIAPSKIQSADDEAAYVAFYTLIISLIAFNGNEISEAKLKRALERLNATTNTFNSNKTADTLAKLLRQGYLVKNIDKNAGQHGEEEATTWYVGSKGKMEVNNEAIAAFTRAVYGDSVPELETKLETSLKIKGREAEEDNEAEGGAQQNDGRANGHRQQNGHQNGESSRRRSARQSNAQDEEDEDEDDEGED